MVNQKDNEDAKCPNRWDWLENLENQNANTNSDSTGNKDNNKKFSFLNFPQVKPSLLLHETPQSLDGKIPMVPGPTEFVVLSTTKFGTKRFVVPPDAEFDLNNPNHGPGGPHQEYNFLHDPHLYEYLHSPAIKERLVEKGLITKEGDVKCTIKEFNEYRQWIRKLKLDALDQEWHLKQAKRSSKEKKKPCNSEITQLSKQRQQRAKELYKQKEAKREQERLRYLRLAEEKEVRIEEMKKKMSEKYKERRKTHNLLLNIRIARKNVKERESKKIRLKILNEGKETVKKREVRIKSIHDDKLTEKEKKAMELWRRRQGYSMSQMKELRSKQKTEKKEREKHIKRRESVYLKERRKSEAHALQFSTANRENALRHLQEADEFMKRREAKKIAKIDKWKERLRSLEEREQLLAYYRQKRCYEQQYGQKYPKANAKGRQSVWDIDRSLLKQVMGDFTNEEQDELASYCEDLSEASSAKLSPLLEDESVVSFRPSENRKRLSQDPPEVDSSEGEMEIERSGENSDSEEMVDNMDTGKGSKENPLPEDIEALAGCESHNAEVERHLSHEVFDKVSNIKSQENGEELNRSSMHLDIATMGKDRPSFIDFGNIQADALQSVYHQGRRMSLASDHEHRSCITNLEIPGLIIEHTESRTAFSPCVFDVDHEITSSSESETEEIVKQESQTSTSHGWGRETTQSLSQVLRHSSRESGIKSVEADFSEFPPVNASTTTPLTYRDSSDKSLVDCTSINESDKINGEVLVEVAKTLVNKSLVMSAKSSGFSNDRINSTLGVYYDASGFAILDVDDDIRKSSRSHSFDSSTKSDVTAASKLGPIASSKISRSASSSLLQLFVSPEGPEVSDSIQNLAKDFVETSMIGAAIALGYTSGDVAGALGMKTGRESLQWDDLPEEYDSCIRSVTKEVVFQAGKLLGFDENQTKEALLNTGVGVKLEKRDSINSLSSSITKVGRDLAESAVSLAIRRLESEDAEQVSIVHHKEIEERLSRPSTQMSQHSLKKPSGISPDMSGNLSAMISHNALRSAAMALGYAPGEVDKKIGTEKNSSKMLDVIPTNSRLSLSKYSEKSARKSVKESAAMALENAPGEVDKKIGMERNSAKILDDIPTNSRISLPRYSEKSAQKSVEEWASKSNPGNIPDGSFMNVYSSSSDDGPVGKESNELLREQSKLLVQGCIQNAVLQLSFQPSERVSLTPEPSVEQIIVQKPDDELLKVVANDLVADVIGKSVEKVKAEKRKAAECEDKKLKTASLKLSMLVIGSAGRASGYSDVEIVRALDRDRQESYKKKRKMSLERFEEAISGRGARRPSVLKSSSYQPGERRLSIQGDNVKFNETSITEARRASLSIPQGRRASIRERPLTPRPRSSDVGLLDNDHQSRDTITSQVHFDDRSMAVNKPEQERHIERKKTPYTSKETQQKMMEELRMMNKEEEIANENITQAVSNGEEILDSNTIIPKKQRRPSPYVSTVAHKKVVQELKNNEKFTEDVLEEDDAEDSSNGDNQDEESCQDENSSNEKEEMNSLADEIKRSKVKSRKSTPYVSPQMHQQMRKDIEKSMKEQTSTFDEIDEDVDDIAGQESLPSWQQELIKQNTSEKKWSGEFLNKVSSIVDETMSDIVDFSEETEANMLCKIARNIDKNKSIANEEMCEYPTESDFLQRLSKEQVVVPTLEGLETENLNHGLLDLYSVIQQDIENILDNPYSVCSEILDSQNCNQDLIKPKFSENILEEANESSVQSSSRCSLPKIEATSQGNLMGNSDSIPSINSKSKNNDIHLPHIPSRESVKSGKSNASRTSATSRVSDCPLPPVSSLSGTLIKRRDSLKHPSSQFKPFSVDDDSKPPLPFNSEVLSTFALKLHKSMSLATILSVASDVALPRDLDTRQCTPEALKSTELEQSSENKVSFSKPKESSHSINYKPSLSKSASDKDATIADKESIEKPRFSCSMSHIRRLSQQSSNAKSKGSSHGSNYSAGSKTSAASAESRESQRTNTTITSDSSNSNSSMKLKNRVLNFIENNNNNITYYGGPLKCQDATSKGALAKVLSLHNLHSRSSFGARSAGGILNKSSSVPKHKIRSLDDMENRLNRSSKSFNVTRETRSLNEHSSSQSTRTRSKVKGLLRSARSGPRRSSRSFSIKQDIDKIRGISHEIIKKTLYTSEQSNHSSVSSTISVHQMADVCEESDGSSRMTDIDSYIDALDGIDSEPEEVEERELCTSPPESIDEGLNERINFSSDILCDMYPEGDDSSVLFENDDGVNNKVDDTEEDVEVIQSIQTKSSHGDSQTLKNNEIVEKKLEDTSTQKSLIEAKSQPVTRPKKISVLNMSFSDDFKTKNAMKYTKIVRKKSSHNYLPSKKSVSYNRLPERSYSSASRKDLLPDGKSNSMQKMIPSPPLSKRGSRVFGSRSLNLVRKRSSRKISRSKSLGASARKLNSIDSLEKFQFKEVIPVIGEGKLSENFKELKSNSPMTNDVKTVKSTAKSTASATIWNPMSSLVNLEDKEVTSFSSTTTVVVQPQPSRNPSKQSAHSAHSGKGPIVVAPAESVSFAPCSDPSGSVQSLSEEIQQQISGTSCAEDFVDDSEKLDDN